LVNAKVAALLRSWLVLDFFGESRRTGEPGSSLTTTIFAQSFIGFLFAVVSLPDAPREPRFVAFAAANLTFSMLLMGVGVLGDPARLQRARADRVLLHTAPVGPGALALALALYRGFSLSAVTIGMALPPAILSYWVVGGSLWVVPGYLVMACVLSGLVAGALSVVVAWTRHLGGVARGELLGASLRGVLLGGGFVGFALCLRHLSGTADDLPFGRQGALAWPAYWGARVLEDPFGAWRFGLALAVFGVLLFAASRALLRVPRSSGARGVSPGWLLTLDRLIAGGGPLRGVVTFTSTQLYRSAGFRSKVLPIIGLSGAMIGLSVWGASPEHRFILLGVSLQLPTVLLPLVVGFLPSTDEENTSWVFSTSPLKNELSLAQHAAVISLTTHVLLPIQLIAAVALLLSGVSVVATASLFSFSLALGVCGARLSVSALPCIPFTDESQGMSVDSSHLFALGFVLSGVGAAFAMIAHQPAAMCVGIALLIPVVGGLRRIKQNVA